jgi:ABC-2 type transport system permease protein
VSRGWWTLTLLVARRELRERVSARSFRISTIILVIGVAGAVGIPALVSGGSGPSKVGIVGDDATAKFAGAIAQLARAPSPQAAGTSSALPARGLKRAPTSLSTRLTGMAVVVLIYLLIFIYGQRITSGVVEEKSSRVVEVLLASVRPAELLTGKVIAPPRSAR